MRVIVLRGSVLMLCLMAAAAVHGQPPIPSVDLTPALDVQPDLKKLIVLPRPDLIVDKMAVAGNKLHVCVRNVGKASSTSSVLCVLIYKTDPKTGKSVLLDKRQVLVPGLAPGQVWCTTLVFNFQLKGVTVRATADCHNMVVESNEVNNTKLLVLP